MVGSSRLPSMYLARLELDGFRAFDVADVTPPQSGLVLVLGANNSGKSTLLSAIDALRGNNPTPPISNTASGREAEVIREILRLIVGEGHTRRAAAAATGVPIATIADQLARAQRAGLGWPLPDDLAHSTESGQSVQGFSDTSSEAALRPT